MATCKDVLLFLNGLRAHAPAAELAPADLAVLTQAHLVAVLSSADRAALATRVGGLESARETIEREGAEYAQLMAHTRAEERRTHSILFHFEGAEKRAAEQAHAASDASSLRAAEEDLKSREAAFADLVQQKALLDNLVPTAGGFAALTGLGAIALRDLEVRAYRVSATEFTTYWTESQRVDADLERTADASGACFGQLQPRLANVDRSYLWAVGIGLAKTPGEPAATAAAFLGAYDPIASWSPNVENRLLSAEIVASLGRPPAELLPQLAELQRAVASTGVPRESSLGVAAILLAGQRQDGSFATANLPAFLALTRSYEAAALLSVINAPFADLSGKFTAARTQFQAWGYQPSEDVELSSAYLTVSDLPIAGIGTKLAIIARGIGTYLEYPLVAASILAAIPVLEANETLTLLERGYDVLGRRTGPMPAPELMCLAVRLLHGIRVASVDELDASAAARPGPVAPSTPYLGPRFFFVPVLVAHGHYFSTYGAFGGAHPGHVHAFGGFTG